MTEKKRGASGSAKRSDRPPADLAVQLKTKRAEFVQTFFKKGAEFTEELVAENDRLRKHQATLERDNAALRAQLASDTAIRDLLSTIKKLEREKNALLSSMSEAEAVTGRFAGRFAEIETELENFANLYVASYQLHSTLRLPVVMRHLKELLVQLVGARALAFYVVDEEKNELVAVMSEGSPALLAVPLRDDDGERLPGAAALIERAFLTGIAHVVQGDIARARDGADAPSLPVACVPMRIDDEIVGVIVVFSLLEQKRGFAPVDYELFKLLGAHAGTALVAAQLFAQAGGKVPGLENLREAATQS